MDHDARFEFLNSPSIQALLDEVERTRAYWRLDQTRDDGIPIPWVP